MRSAFWGPGSSDGDRTAAASICRWIRMYRWGLREPGYDEDGTAMNSLMRLVLAGSVLCALLFGMAWAETPTSPSGMPSPHGEVPATGAFAPDGPFGQTIASVQALTLSGKEIVYAGSFGNGI